ncbi:MAG: histidine kinase, partial [Lachnospiraceae bacterium]|nr:histidine kinase [Lachnospiraceae bacterium]
VIRLYINNSQIQMDLLAKQHENEMTEMMALQLQINPHFIFNTLQTLDFEAIKKLGNQAELHHMIQLLAFVVKYALSEPTAPVTLREELDYLKSYIEIQNIRFDRDVITYFEVDDEILDCKVFRMILQPVLENCFEHGVDSRKERIVVKVKIYDRGDHISFAVLDNGRGVSKADIGEIYRKINSRTSRNIGLTNLNRRLIRRYGAGYALKIQGKEGFGTIVSFNIPKESDNNENLN